MDSCYPVGQLDRTVEATVKRLDQMLVQLEGYRPLLEQNVNYAEFDIKATFDSLVDALGQRQMHLLKQLDKIAKEKASMIDSQKQVLENLRSNIISCMSSRHKNTAQMQDYVSRAESALLSSSSAPFVSFRTEKSVMHQTIASYGRIVSQYCGHFADPSQPSSCLPRALEEEDENDESIDYGYNAQSMVFNHIHMPNSRIKPHLRQWLSDEHSMERSKFARIEQKKATYSTVSDVLASHSGLSSQQTTPLHTPKTIGSQPGAIGHVPRRMGDSLSVRDWLDMYSLNKLSDRPKEQCSRKFSQALSFGSSDGVGATDSESFIALTGSSGRLTNLKDWLFCDPIELTDMPGLSAPAESQPLFTSPRTSSTQAHTFDLSNWLAPTTREKASISAAVSGRLAALTLNETHEPVTVSRPPLLPLHLTESAPVDMDRWLLRSDHSEGPDVRTEEESDRPSTATANIVAPFDSGARELVEEPAAHDEPTEDRLASLDDGQVPDCCIYSQCRGGPGGPTCCGARNPGNRLGCSVSIDKGNVVPNSNDSSNAQPAPLQTQQDLTTSDASVATHPVVAQFQLIASTPLQQWLTGSAPTGVNSNVVKCQAESDIREWLYSEDMDASDNRASDDKPIALKRRLCPGSNNCTGVCSSCPNAEFKSDPTKSSIDVDKLPECMGSPNLDRWLLRKNADSLIA